MYVIICLKDGRKELPVPIVDSKDPGKMAVFKTEDEAYNFSLENMLCQISETLIIDIDNLEFV